MKLFLTILSGCLLLLCSCGGGGNSLTDKASGNLERYENGDVNAIEQARPTVMVLPSDNLLKRYGAISSSSSEGSTIVTRDYQKYLLANADNKGAVSNIQEAFADAGYPVQDLEQTLKQLSTQKALDIADALDKDTKTVLLTVAAPDIIIELDYRNNINMRGAIKKEADLSYTVNVYDAYTNEVVSSTTKSDVKGESVSDALSKSLGKEMDGTLDDINRHFSDILLRGRNVTIRIAVAGGSPINLESVSVEKETYADWIIDYIKTHTVKGAYKLERNTAREMYFVNCRIPLLNDDGTQFGVYDWAREMTRAMRRDLGVRCSNKARGLGEILITIEGV